MKLIIMLVTGAIAYGAIGENIITREPSKIWNLDELYKTPQTRRWDTGGATTEMRQVLIKSESWQGKDTWVYAYYGIPEYASKSHPVPAIVLVHGGLGTAYLSWVATWVRRGYAAICVDNCGSFPIRTAEGKWLKNPEGGPTGWGRLDLVNEPERDQWVYHAVAAVVRSHSFLRSLPGVDANMVGITGISWGGFLTCIAAAVDTRFAYAIPVYGCGFNCGETNCLFARQKHKDRIADVEKWFALWDPAVYLANAKCPFLWVDGTNDAFFRLDCVRQSADLVQGPNAFATITRMIHGHGSYGENQPEIFAFADHYAKGERDVVRFKRAETTNGVFTVSYAHNGRNIVRAELVYTTDGDEVEWKSRYWQTQTIEHFDKNKDILHVTIPAAARYYYVNLIDYNGLVSSSPLMNSTFRSDLIIESKDFNIRDFGANTNLTPSANAAAIQKAVDAASSNGRGRVIVPEGEWVSGTFWLKSGVELHLKKGAVLKASPNLADYNREDAYPENFGCPKTEYWRGFHFIICRGANDVSITGEGTIHGNGDVFFDEKPLRYFKSVNAWWNGVRWAKDKVNLRPGQLVVFIKCRNLRVEGITICNAPCWSLYFHGCSDIVVRNYTVRNGPDDGNTDGVDVDCCQNVLLEDLDIDTGDDAIAIRGAGRRLGLDPEPPCENVVVRRAKLKSTSSVFRIGVGAGLIRNVTVEGVTSGRGGTAINLNACYGDPEKGGVDMENIVFRRCRFDNCRVAYNIWNAGKKQTFGIRNILFDEVSFSPEASHRIGAEKGSPEPQNIVIK